MHKLGNGVAVKVSSGAAFGLTLRTQLPTEHGGA